MINVLDGTGPIVLVDDSEVDLVVARRCFKYSRLDRSLLTFTSGSAFLTHLFKVEDGGEQLPALVLLDINLGDQDGFEVLKRARARPAFAALPPFVMLTNSDDPRDLERAHECGARGLQTKPMLVRDYVAFFDSLQEP